MIRKEELIDAINELQSGKHSIQNCERLAAVYTVLDHAYPSVGAEPQRDESVHGYSGDLAVDLVGSYGDSEFLAAVSGKKQTEVWMVLDELADALMVLNPRLYNNFIEKLEALR